MEKVGSKIPGLIKMLPKSARNKLVTSQIATKLYS